MSEEFFQVIFEASLQITFRSFPILLNSDFKLLQILRPSHYYAQGHHMSVSVSCLVQIHPKNLELFF